MTKQGMRRGFTLIELLVAVAIFAVLSAMAWKIFDYISTVKARNSQHELALANLQQAYQQILRDSLQIVPFTASVEGEVQAALILENNRLIFSKTGVSDPLQQGMPPVERIEYYYDANAQILYRQKYASIHQVRSAEALSSVVLANVQQFEMTVLNPEPQTQWPTQNTDTQDIRRLQYLPKGLAIKLTIDDVQYDWIFTLLSTDYLQSSGVGG